MVSREWRVRRSAPSVCITSAGGVAVSFTWLAHLMRQDLRPALAGASGVRLTGRYPQVHLDAPDAVETHQRLAVRFKR